MDTDKKTTSVEITQIFSESEVTLDFYSCEEAIIRLNDYLDHELDQAQRADVVKHLQICQPCLERFHFEEKLIAEIKCKVAYIMAPCTLKDRLAKAIKNLVT